MRKTVAAVMAAGSLVAGALLAGLGATPALAQSRPITLLCSPGSNGGTLVNGVCVLPAAAVGHQLLGPFTGPWDGTNWRIVATPAASASWPA